MDTIEIELREKFSQVYIAINKRYQGNDDTIKSSNFIKEIFQKSHFKEHEMDACFLLIKKCEETCNDMTRPDKSIFGPLNDLCQFMVRIRKKNIEDKKLNRKINRKSFSENLNKATNSESDNDANLKRDSDVNTNSETNLDEKSDAETNDVKKPEKEANSDRISDPENNSDKKPNTETNSYIISDPKAYFDKKTETKANSDRKSDQEKNSDKKSNSKTSSDRKSDSENNSDNKPNPETNSYIISDPEANSDKNSNLEENSDKKSDPEKNSDTETYSYKKSKGPTTSSGEPNVETNLIRKISVESKLNQFTNESNIDLTIEDGLDEEENETENQLSEKDLKRLARMRKLDKQLLEYNQKIHEYENLEIDFDDSDFEEKQEQNYENEARMKKAFLKGKNYLENQMKKYPHLVEAGVKFEKYHERVYFRHTRFQEINLEIERNLNKKKSREIFPDYADVQLWVNKANTEANLNLSIKQIEEISKDSFKEIGRLLKRKRYREDEFIQKTRLKDIKKFEKKLEGKTSDSESNSNLTEDDPAENNKELAEKLIANSKKAKEEEKKIIDKYVQLQLENKDKTETDGEENEEEEDEESKSSNYGNGSDESMDESFSSENFNVENHSDSENDGEEKVEEVDEKEERNKSENLKETSPIKHLQHSTEADKPIVSLSLSHINGIQSKPPTHEKSVNKRPFDSVQEAETSEKENSTSDSSSDSKRSKIELKSTKRNIRPTQLIETENEKEANKSIGIYSKKIRSLNPNESPSKNSNDLNKSKITKSPTGDDCIILD